MTCEILNRLRVRRPVHARGDEPLFGTARAYTEAMRQEKRRLGSGIDRKNAPDEPGLAETMPATRGRQSSTGRSKFDLVRRREAITSY